MQILTLLTAETLKIKIRNTEGVQNLIKSVQTTAERHPKPNAPTLLKISKLFVIDISSIMVKLL